MGPGGVVYEADSFSQTEFLGRFALGGGLTIGSRELILEGVLHASPVGAGIVEVEPVATFADTEVDYGRETLFDLG